MYFSLLQLFPCSNFFPFRVNTSNGNVEWNVFIRIEWSYFCNELNLAKDKHKQFSWSGENKMIGKKTDIIYSESEINMLRHGMLVGEIVGSMMFWNTVTISVRCDILTLVWFLLLISMKKIIKHEFRERTKKKRKMDGKIMFSFLAKLHRLYQC